MLAAWMTALGLADYESLWRWSVEKPADFWNRVWDEFGVVGDKGGTVLLDGALMPGARWFPDARINFAENLLAAPGNGDALVFWGEDKLRQRWDHARLRDAVGRCARVLRRAGVGVGDRVAAYLPNLPEALVAMLATASLGAIWSSASPDFGVQGVLDRFGQIEPKVLLCVDGYWYNGKAVDCRGKNAEVAARLTGLSLVLVVPYPAESPDLGALPGAQS